MANETFMAFAQPMQALCENKLARKTFPNIYWRYAILRNAEAERDIAGEGVIGARSGALLVTYYHPRKPLQAC